MYSPNCSHFYPAFRKRYWKRYIFRKWKKPRVQNSRLTKRSTCSLVTISLCLHNGTHPHHWLRRMRNDHQFLAFNSGLHIWTPDAFFVLLSLPSLIFEFLRSRKMYLCWKMKKRWEAISVEVTPGLSIGERRTLYYYSCVKFLKKKW